MSSERQRAISRDYMRQKRWMDPEQRRLREVYEELVGVSGEVCAVCGDPPTVRRRLALDHCHKTNEVRGLLCPRCNLLIGQAKDSVEILRAAIDYLSRDAYTGRYFAEALRVAVEVE